MTKEIFLKTIKEHLSYSDRIDEISRIIQAPICESPIIDIPFIWFDRIIELSFNKTGIDIVYSYLFDNDSRYYEDSEKNILIDNDEDLWEYVKQYLK